MMDYITETNKLNMCLNFLRNNRDDKLKHTDVLMCQTDRLTVEDMQELKQYRQALRDMIDLKAIMNHQELKFPDEPKFLSSLNKTKQIFKDTPYIEVPMEIDINTSKINI